MMIPRLEISFPLRRQGQYLFGKPYLPQQNEFLLNHARSGIVLALRALELPVGSKVGMMVYNCHTVMNAVQESGCVPVFIDINDNLTIDSDDLKRKGGGLRALVVTHLFGIENDVAAIRRLYPDLPIIEDCAHAFGKEHAEGDFAVYSIGQGKLPSVGDGGILQVNNHAYLPAVGQLYASLPDYSFMENANLFCRLWLKSVLNLPLVYKHLTLPLKRRRARQSGKEKIVLRRMSKGVSAVYNAVHESVGGEIIKRRQNAENMMRELGERAETEKILCGDNAFMMAVVCDNPSALRKQLYKNGIDSATHFSQSLTWAAEFGYQHGQCPNAEKLTNRLLMIPTYKSR